MTKKKTNARVARQPDSRRRPTASKVSAKRKSAASVHRESEPPHPPPHEQWATVAVPDKFSRGKYRMCLWGGDRALAVEQCESDERVCRVRIEVLEVI